MEDIQKASLALQAICFTPKARAALKNESAQFHDNLTGTTSQAVTTPTQDAEDAL